MIELPHADYSKVQNIVACAEMNMLFALAVVKRSVQGKIYVDSFENPTTVYVAHPYGMSLLIGQTCHEKFNKNLKTYLTNQAHVRQRIEWLQIYPTTEWMNVFEHLLEDSLIQNPTNGSEDTSKILCYQRFNYRFSPTHYFAKKKALQEKHSYAIVKTSKEIFEHMSGSVVPRYFWDSWEAFDTNSLGYSAMSDDGELLATAFISFVDENKHELGIETALKHRGKGYAYAVASRLIDACLEDGFEPVWACSSLNVGSQKLAEKLGFELAMKIPYYKLPYSNY